MSLTLPPTSVQIIPNRVLYRDISRIIYFGFDCCKILNSYSRRVIKLPILVNLFYALLHWNREQAWICLRAAQRLH